MVQLSFNVQGHVQLSRNMRIFMEKLTDLREFFVAAIAIVESRSDQLWSAEGSNVEKANPWPPLGARTLRAREKRWGYYRKAPSRPGVLRWTGNLQDSRARSFSDKFGRLEFSMPYAPYHQRGGTNLPRRVIVDLSNPTNAEIVRALQDKVHRDVGIFGRQA